MISVVIPTYQREAVLLDTVRLLRELQPPPIEILIVDQTETHLPGTEKVLQAWASEGIVRWFRLAYPSIPRAMNLGLQRARADIVLFVDDDIIPGVDLLSAHARAHADSSCGIVAGQVLQPGETVLASIRKEDAFRFCSADRCWVEEFVGCNFSVKRDLALSLGGFDENFVRVAYRFEAEFSDRAMVSGARILFEPQATVRHLQSGQGGTRAYGRHLTTVKPSHSVGAYYYILRARRIRNRLGRMAERLLRSVRTRHHLRHPWWIPGTLVAELWGLLWALRLHLAGPRLIGAAPSGRESDG